MKYINIKMGKMWIKIYKRKTASFVEFNKHIYNIQSRGYASSHPLGMKIGRRLSLSWLFKSNVSSESTAPELNHSRFLAIAAECEKILPIDYYPRKISSILHDLPKSSAENETFEEQAFPLKLASIRMHLTIFPFSAELIFAAIDRAHRLGSPAKRRPLTLSRRSWGDNAVNSTAEETPSPA